MTPQSYAGAPLTAAMLAPERIDDQQFFEATERLSTRFDRRSADGDLRFDEGAPRVLLDWLRHAEARVPDFRVWDLGCQLESYLDPCLGLYLPHDWPWDTRDRVLSLNAALRELPAWRGAVEAALLGPDDGSVRAIACCAAERLGLDPFGAVWAHLCEHPDEGYLWHLIAPLVDLRRLPSYLRLARSVLIGAPGAPAESRDGVGSEVLRKLRDHPGHGLDLLEWAMRAGSDEERALAAEVLLAAWGDERIPPDTRTLASELLSREEYGDARRRLLTLGPVGAV